MKKYILSLLAIFIICKTLSAAESLNSGVNYIFIKNDSDKAVIYFESNKPDDVQEKMQFFFPFSEKKLESGQSTQVFYRFKHDNQESYCKDGIYIKVKKENGEEERYEVQTYSANNTYHYVCDDKCKSYTGMLPYNGIASTENKSQPTLHLTKDLEFSYS